MVIVKRRLIRCSVSGLIALALLGMAGCAASRSSKEAIARNTVDLPSGSEQLRETAPVERPGVVSTTSSQGTRRPQAPIVQASAADGDERPAASGETLPKDDSTILPAVNEEVNAPEGDVAQVSNLSEATSSEMKGSPANAATTLSLGGILQLADAQNPNVAVARERINEAYARVERAGTLWLPSLRAGLNYNHHEGSIQDVAGNVFQTNRSAFGGGFGTNMSGAASPGVPGLIAQFHLSDAIFQPKIAAHQAASRQFGAVAARNDVLRDASVAYLELVRAEHGMAIAKRALENTEKLAEMTRQYSQTGQGLESDHQRMEAELAIRRDQLAIQQESVQVASARLAQVLHADPSVLIATGEPAVTALDIMAVEDSAAAYVAWGLSRRPELSEQKHLVCEAVERLNREKYAPLVPSVLLGMSYGGMGGGLGNSISNGSSRFDADAVAYWEIRNMGFGDRAARGETASATRQAQMRELALLDRVAREVVEAHTQVVQRKQRLELSRKGIVAAERSYELNLQRIANAQGLPIEVLQSIQALANAHRAYLNAVVDYNIAQFELSRATGWFVE